MKWTRLLPLALGSFAIGTDDFIVAGMLPLMARDLHVTVALAGLQVTVFSLVHAIGTPIFASFTQQIERKKVLVMSMSVFILANVLTALVSSFGVLMAMRVLAAASGAIFSPVATSMAAELTPPEHRGKALSIVTGGFTVSLVLGVPIGAAIGDLAGWRAGFIFVALLSVGCVAGMVAALPRLESSAGPSFRERFRPAASPEVALALVQTFLIIGVTFIVFTYLGSLTSALDSEGRNVVAPFLLLYGLAAVGGNVVGGRLADRWGGLRTALRAVFVLGLSLAGMSMVGWLPSGPSALAAAGLVVVVWGFSGWSFTPAQFSRLAQMSPQQMPMAFALNTSAIYLGVAFGSFVGSLVLAKFSVFALGWTAAMGEAVGLLLLLASYRLPASAPPGAMPAPASPSRQG
jgi:predicted MFS family arabinose efflux permease